MHSFHTETHKSTRKIGVVWTDDIARLLIPILYRVAQKSANINDQKSY